MAGHEDTVKASGADGLAGRFPLVAAKVIENRRLARCELRRKTFQGQREELSVDGTIDRQGMLIQSQPSEPGNVNRDFSQSRKNWC